MPEHSPGGVQFPIFSDLIKHGNSPSALADWFKALALTSDVQSNDVADAARIAAIDDATTKYGGLPQRVSDVEQKNTEQDGRLDESETKSVEQEGRLGDLEALQPTKTVRLEGGAWVWDPANATHYVLIDHAGSPVVRATPWPIPNPTTPELDW